MKCPHCETEIKITTHDLKNHSMSVVIKHDGEYLKAKTVGGVITNMAALLSEVSKNMDGKVNVAFGGIEQKDRELTINFIVTEISSLR